MRRETMCPQMTRQSFLVNSGKAVLGASLAGTLLAGCGGGSNGSSELILWREVNQGDREYFSKNVERPFEKANPKIDLKVNWESSEDIYRLVRTALQGGEGPDLVPTYPAAAIEEIQANIPLPLDEYAERYGWQEKILGWALDSGRFEDKLYHLPTEVETTMLFYNKTLFEEKGWTPPQSREELEGVAEEAKSQGIVPFAAGNVDWRPTTEWFVSMFWNHYSGSEALYQALTGELTWTDPIFVEPIDLLNQYFQNSWYSGGVDQYFSTNNDTLLAQLGDGKAAMHMAGSWLLSEIGAYFGHDANNDNVWDWVPPPSLRDELAYPLFELGIGSSIAVNSQSEVPDAAAAYLDWYFSDPERVAQRIADIPGVYDLPIHLQSEDFPSGTDPRTVEVLTALSDATSKGNYGYSTWTFWPPETHAFVYEGMEEVITGNMTPAEYCAEHNRIFKEELKNGDVPKIIEPGTA
jgi:raffinose/stachyose/melibiose transport system substrate-binding protein